MRRLFHLLKCQSPYGTPERRVATGVSRRLEKAGFRTGIFVKFHKKSIAGLPGDFDGPSGWVLLIRPLRTRCAPPLCTVPVFIYAGSISVHVVCSKFFLRWRRYPGVLGYGRPGRRSGAQKFKIDAWRSSCATNGVSDVVELDLSFHMGIISSPNSFGLLSYGSGTVSGRFRWMDIGWIRFTPLKRMSDGSFQHFESWGI